MTPDKIEEIVLKRVLYIGDNEWKLKGYPQQLIDKLTQHHQDLMSEVVEQAVEEHVGKIITACFYNDGTKKSVTDVIDVEVPALIKKLTSK